MRCRTLSRDGTFIFSQSENGFSQTVKLGQVEKVEHVDEKYHYLK